MTGCNLCGLPSTEMRDYFTICMKCKTEGVGNETVAVSCYACYISKNPRPKGYDKWTWQKKFVYMLDNYNTLKSSGRIVKICISCYNKHKKNSLDKHI